VIAVKVIAAANAPNSETVSARARRKFELNPSAAERNVASQRIERANVGWFNDAYFNQDKGKLFT
jgi:hypothetical protein